MVKVMPESDKLGFPLEGCVFCSRGTQYWSVEKDVPVCRACARIKFEHQVPSKEEWISREQKNAHKKARNTLL